MKEDTPSPELTSEQSEWNRLFQELFDNQEDPDPEEIARQVDEQMAARRADADAVAAPDASPWRKVVFTVLGVLLLGGLVTVAVIYVPPLLRSMRNFGTPPVMAPTQTPGGTSDSTGPSITFAPLPEDSVTVGETVELSVKVTDGAGAPLTGKAVSWSVEPPSPNQAAVVQPLTDSEGVARYNFSGDAPGEVTVTAVVSDTTAALPLTVRPAPLPLVLRPVAIEETHVAGQSVKLEFHVDNTGQQAYAVRFELDLPDGTLFEEQKSPKCRLSGIALVTCEVGNVGPGNDVGSILVYLLIEQPGAFTLTPAQYRLVSASQEVVPGAQGVQLTVAPAPPLAPSELILSAFPPEVPADGRTPTTVSVAVKDQNGQPFTDAVTVQLTLASDPAAPPAPATAPELSELECKVANFRNLRSTSDFNIDTNIVGRLETDTIVTALAYDKTVSGGEWLYIRVSAEGDQNGLEGYVIETYQGGTALQCDTGDYTQLPAVPLAWFDRLETNEVSFTGGQQAVTFTPGFYPGTATINATLSTADGTSLTSSLPITLLEAGTLARTDHAYSNQLTAEGRASEGIVIFQLPVDTPLELYPLPTTEARAREAAVRLWVPTSLVPGVSVGPATLGTASNNMIYIGDGPNDGRNLSTSERQLQAAASSLPVEVLNVNNTTSLTLVRLRVWINVDDIAPGGQ